ncbi:hypothetical protein J2X72_004587 [Phyllobacterium sp. 1468]|nr:hypothetical protein [Phyllobacterium sp. 1468]
MSKLRSFLEPKAKAITFDCYGTLVQWFEVLQH